MCPYGEPEVNSGGHTIDCGHTKYRENCSLGYVCKFSPQHAPSICCLS